MLTRFPPLSAVLYTKKKYCNQLLNLPIAFQIVNINNEKLIFCRTTYLKNSTKCITHTF